MHAALTLAHMIRTMAPTIRITVGDGLTPHHVMTHRLPLLDLRCMLMLTTTYTPLNTLA